MDLTAQFLMVPQESPEYLSFTVNFCHLPITSPFDDENLKSGGSIPVEIQSPLPSHIMRDVDALTEKMLILSCVWIEFNQQQFKCSIFIFLESHGEGEQNSTQIYSCQNQPSLPMIRDVDALT